MRPGSLAEVARRATTSRELAYALPEFLDEFAAHPDASRLAEEPQRLHTIDSGELREDLD